MSSNKPSSKPSIPPKLSREEIESLRSKKPSSGNFWPKMDLSLDENHSLLYYVKPYARIRPSGTVELTLSLQVVDKDKKGNQQSCTCEDCQSLGQELIDEIRHDYTVLNSFLADISVGSYMRLTRTFRGYTFEEEDIDVEVQDCVIE